MLQVAALPSPDAAEMAAMDQELLAIEATLADLQEHLLSQGYDVCSADKQLTSVSQPSGSAVPTAQQLLLLVETGTARARCKPTGSPDTIVSSKQTSTHEEAAQQPVAGQQNVAPHLLCGTDRSLADIDAVMQVRGYR